MPIQHQAAFSSERTQREVRRNPLPYFSSVSCNRFEQQCIRDVLSPKWNPHILLHCFGNEISCCICNFLKSYQYPAVELHKCQHVHAMSSKIQKSAGSPLEIHDPAVRSAPLYYASDISKTHSTNPLLHKQLRTCLVILKVEISEGKAGVGCGVFDCCLFALPCT
jgi:hypothetical protein